MATMTRGPAPAGVGSARMSVQTPTGHRGTAAATAAIAAAEAVLARRFGATITLADPEDLGGAGPATVVRVRVADSPFALPRTLVVKQYPEAAHHAFAREATSYQLFNALAEHNRVCPELIAHGIGELLLVLADLGTAPTLADTLMGADARGSEHALLSTSRALGRMHATTAGREADFDTLLRRQGGDPPIPEVSGMPAQTAVGALLAEASGVDGLGVVEHVAARTSWLLDGGRHRAFSPGRLCPENHLVTADGTRLLDFEGGCMREVLLDVGYLLMPFTSCWCAFALPAGMAEAMLAVWRAEVVTVWPDLSDDDELHRQLVDALLLWTWRSTPELLPRPEEADSPITADRPSPHRGAVLALRWRELARAAGSCGVDELAECATAVAAGLTRRFPGDVEVFPAFRRPGSSAADAGQ